MGLLNKIKWVLGILIIFVLILATNLIDRNNFLRIKNSVDTIYKDRLVASDIIFELLKSVQEKEIAAVTSDSVFFLERNEQVNNHINSLIARFDQTKLTRDEGKVFDDFKNNLKKLSASEKAFISAQKTAIITNLSNVKENLSDLSKIQLNEGGKINSVNKQAVDSMELYTQIEIYFLVFLAIIIQIIIMYNPKEKK